MNMEMENIQPIASDIKLLIEKSRQNVALSVNATMSSLYWQIGKRINDEVVQDK